MWFTVSQFVKVVPAAYGLQKQVLLGQQDVYHSETGPQPTDVFGEGKTFVTCCCTKQLNLFLKISGENFPGCLPLVAGLF